jgi:hypothetical protein
MAQHVTKPLWRGLRCLESRIGEPARERPEGAMEVRDAAVDVSDIAMEVETRGKGCPRVLIVFFRRVWR